MPSGRTHRLVVLGGEQVGKTAIIEQLIFGNHVVGQGGLSTLGDIYEVSIETEKSTNEKLQIFDTPGMLFASSKQSYEQDHFLSIADGVILVYDVTSKPSYDIMVSIRQRVAIRNSHIPIVVLGNKVDLNHSRTVPSSKAQQWARSHGLRPFDVTVINRDSLKEPFSYIAWRMGNPGKPFSVLPLLATASLSLTHPPTPTSVDPKQPQADTPLASPDALNEASGQNLLGYHDDSYYPSKGTLFFADCLSTKSKAHFHNRD